MNLIKIYFWNQETSYNHAMGLDSVAISFSAQKSFEQTVPSLCELDPRREEATQTRACLFDHYSTFSRSTGRPSLAYLISSCMNQEPSLVSR